MQKIDFYAFLILSSMFLLHEKVIIGVFYLLVAILIFVLQIKR